MLTKNDLHAMRNANDICVHLNLRHPTGLVRLIKRKPYNAKPFETDQEHDLPATVKMETLEGKRAVEAGTAQCFAMAGIYAYSSCPLSTIVKSLRVGDELEFSFYPDAHTQAYVAAAGLHGDALNLRVARKGKTVARYEITSSICPANSARMCRGVPNTSDYDRQAQEGRRLIA